MTTAANGLVDAADPASGPVTYEIQVLGHLDDHWTARLADMSITHNDDGTSTLKGPLADQAQLHGVLSGLRDIGAPLLRLCSKPDAPPESADRPTTVMRGWLREQIQVTAGGAGRDGTRR